MAITDIFTGGGGSNKIKSAGLFTGQQNELFQMLIQMLMGGGAGGQPQLMSLAGLEEFTRQGLTDTDRTFLSETVDQPAIERFQQDILPQISRTFGSGGGFYGSERIRSQERATQQLGQTLSGERAKFALGKEGQRLQATGMIGQLDTQRAQLLAQILGIPQKENIAFQTPGQEGLMQMLMSIFGSFAGGAGGAIGASAFGGGAGAGGASSGAAAGGTGAALSDERLKENVELIDNALEKLSNLKGVTWDWNAEGKELPGTDYNVGVLAQDIEKEYPNLVNVGPEGFKQVNYHGLVGIAIEGINELAGRVEALEA